MPARKGSSPADLVFDPTPACRSARHLPVASHPLPARSPPPGQDLLLNRAMLSGRNRLTWVASPAAGIDYRGDTPRATTDPDWNRTEDSTAPPPPLSMERAAVRRTTLRAPAVMSTRAQAGWSSASRASAPARLSATVRCPACPRRVPVDVRRFLRAVGCALGYGLGKIYAVF